MDGLEEKNGLSEEFEASIERVINFDSRRFIDSKMGGLKLSKNNRL